MPRIYKNFACATAGPIFAYEIHSFLLYIYFVALEKSWYNALSSLLILILGC